MDKYDSHYNKWSRIADEAGAHKGSEQSSRDRDWQIRANLEMGKALSAKSELNKKILLAKQHEKKSNSIHKKIFSF